MPLFNFKCTNPACGKDFEKLTKFGQEVNCDCGAKAEKVLVAPNTFIVKGDGAYRQGVSIRGNMK